MIVGKGTYTLAYSTELQGLKKWADDEAFQREVMRVKQDNKMRQVFKLIFFLACIIFPAFTPIVPLVEVIIIIELKVLLQIIFGLTC